MHNDFVAHIYSDYVLVFPLTREAKNAMTCYLKSNVAISQWSLKPVEYLSVKIWMEMNNWKYKETEDESNQE